jgi:ABC-type transport system involved in multi-copper enzyme maturation permease subunit
MAMLRALFRKEWMQLRALRWVGFCLGALMPLLLIALAEAASRGLTPYGRLSDYSNRDLFMDALPIMLAALWGLLALLICSQAFAGDRASGTEQFLLERPVRRSAIWRARLLASAVSILVLVLSHLILWAALVEVSVNYSSEQWLHSLLIMGGFGGLLLLIAFTGSIAAAAFAGSPMQAVLLGMVFAIPPIALSSVLGEGFPLAAIGPVPVGMLIPWLLPIGYLFASFLMNCRGEPSGRGKYRRGAWALGLSILAVGLIFLIAAPLAVRANARISGAGAIPIAAGQGSSACLLDYSWRSSSAWIVDLERKRRLRFLPPPVWDAAWSTDGKRLAVLHSAGSLGRLRSGTVIDLFDARGDRVGERINVGGADEWLDDLRWNGDRIIVRSGGGTEGSAVLIISPDVGSLDRVELPEDWWKWWLIGPTAGGDFFIYRLMDEQMMQYGLYRLDLEQAELESDPVIVEEGYPTYSGKWISPSGRYWLRHLGEAEAGMQLTALDNGAEYPLPECRRALWIGTNRLVCLEDREQGSALTIGIPGEPRETLRSWPDGHLALELSPDRGRLMIQVWQQENGSEEEPSGFWSQGAWWKTGGRLRELWLFEVETRKFQELDGLIDEQDDSRPAAIHWAGHETLVLTGPGKLALADLDGEGGWDYIIGKP